MCVVLKNTMKANILIVWKKWNNILCALCGGSSKCKYVNTIEFMHF